MENPTTVKEALKYGESLLLGKAIETSRLDSQVLLAHVLRKTREYLFSEYDRQLSRKELEAYEEILRRRSLREPVAYIRGKKEFYSLELMVNKHVMIPRPETELLIDIALNYLEGLNGNEPLRIIDIGTGSCSLPIAILKNFRDLSLIYVYAGDRCPEALKIARFNVRKHGLIDRVRFYNGNLLEPIRMRFNLVISNPPYVKSGDVDRLVKDVRLYEPRIALDGGMEGLDFVSKLVRVGIDFLLEGGAMIVEVGMDHSRMLRDDPSNSHSLEKYGNVRFIEDYSGVERFLFLQR